MLSLKRDHIKTVGAWCGSSSLAHPERDVDVALELNINRLDVVVNDHSKSRSPRRFTVRDGQKIKTLCKRAQDNGIETHLMSWIMPHKAYIDRAAQLLVPLCEEVGASSLQWDAEEPWTKATHRMRYADAANCMADKFSGLACEMGVAAIGFTPVDKVGPLADICDYMVPQAYSTRTSGVKPGFGQKRIHGRYATKFGKKIVMGLAAFRQKDIPNHSVESAMVTCINQANDLNCDTIIYWNLPAIRGSKAVGGVIRSIHG
jgi:hypothetical protein